jgi:hypothetical protein
MIRDLRFQFVLPVGTMCSDAPSNDEDNVGLDGAGCLSKIAVISTAGRNLLFLCFSTSYFGEKQISPFGRNDSVCGMHLAYGPIRKQLSWSQPRRR